MAIVICAVAVFAHADFGTRAGSVDARAPFAFWILLMAIWGAMNMVFLGGDLFTLYVAIELLTFAAVPLVCLDGRAETLQAALRYLALRPARLDSLPGRNGPALRQLCNARHRPALPPGPYGTRDACCRHADDHRTLRQDRSLSTASMASASPCWRAPAAASAVLSAVVVKDRSSSSCGSGSTSCQGLLGPAGAQLFGGLGAAAIVFGSVVALRQQRLKLLIAYSTVAQIGYLFLMFPLALDTGVGAAPGQRRFDRRHASGDIARDSEGGHVHGRWTYLCGART